MAKFGLFDSMHQQPLQQYEGDRMSQDKEYVYIYQKSAATGREEQVAAIKLDAGYSVKKI